eukprot:364743-Chlamydomonas_euryale.AAC.81
MRCFLRTWMRQERVIGMAPARRNTLAGSDSASCMKRRSMRKYATSVNPFRVCLSAAVFGKELRWLQSSMSI